MISLTALERTKCHSSARPTQVGSPSRPVEFWIVAEQGVAKTERGGIHFPAPLFSSTPWLILRSIPGSSRHDLQDLSPSPEFGGPYQSDVELAFGEETDRLFRTVHAGSDQKF